MLKYTKAKQKKIKRVWVRVGRGEIWGGGGGTGSAFVLFMSCTIRVP